MAICIAYIINLLEELNAQDVSGTIKKCKDIQIMQITHTTQ